MTHRVPLLCGEDQSILIEVRPVEVANAHGLVEQAGGRVATVVQEGLSACGHAIQEIASGVFGKLASLADSSGIDSAELCLSIQAGGGSNWIIVSGTAEATFEVKLTWKRK